MASISCRAVSCSYGIDDSLRNVTLEVADKEFLAVVGEGASALLKFLYGIKPQSSTGEILIGDRVVNRVDSKDRDISYVVGGTTSTEPLFGLSDGNALRSMSIFDNIAQDLRERKTPKAIIDQRVREASKALGIEHLLDRRPKQLSRGQRQRVALARAIVSEPALFLLDDILSPLDRKLQVEARAFLSRLHQRLDTTFIVHCADIEEAMALGTRVLVLKNGEVQQLDTPEAIYTRPRTVHVFTANPLTHAPLLIDGQLIDTGSASCQVNSAIGAIPLTRQQAQALSNAIGKNLTVGVRTEDIVESGYLYTDTAFHFEASVEFTEFVDGTDFVHFNLNGIRGVATADPRSQLRAGARGRFAMNMENVLFFDRTTRMNLIQK